MLDISNIHEKVFIAEQKCILTNVYCLDRTQESGKNYEDCIFFICFEITIIIDHSLQNKWFSEMELKDWITTNYLTMLYFTIKWCVLKLCMKMYWCLFSNLFSNKINYISYLLLSNQKLNNLFEVLILLGSPFRQCHMHVCIHAHVYKNAFLFLVVLVVRNKWFFS